MFMRPPKVTVLKNRSEQIVRFRNASSSRHLPNSRLVRAIISLEHFGEQDIMSGMREAVKEVV